jgi:hypothetical protein
MPIHNRLTYPGDLSGQWPKDPEFPLTFDLGTLALCGVRPGDPVHPLSPLGPCDDSRSGARGTLQYAAQGVQIELTGPTVDSLIIFLKDEQFEPFAGSFLFNGNPVPTPSGLSDLSRLGAAYWRDQDEDEILLFFEFGVRELQVEAELTGRIKALVAVTPPLSDPEQRRRYNVTKNWPPAI